jgi:hypothetical protein
MSIQHLVCPMRIRHQVLQSHCTEEQVLQRSPVRRGAVRHTMDAGSWRMNRPDAMNEEDIPLPSIVELCGRRPSDARITTGCRITKRPSGEATPHPASDKYSQHAVSQSVRRGRSYEAAVTLSVAKDPAVRKVNSATMPALLPASFQGGFMSRASRGHSPSSVVGADSVDRRLVSHHPRPVSRETAMQPKLWLPEDPEHRL